MIERIPANERQPAMIADWRRMADTLCLDGMKHGGNYTTEILAGLPAARATAEGNLQNAGCRPRP